MELWYKARAEVENEVPNLEYMREWVSNSKNWEVVDYVLNYEESFSSLYDLILESIRTQETDELLKKWEKDTKRVDIK